MSFLDPPFSHFARELRGIIEVECGAPTPDEMSAMEAEHAMLTGAENLFKQGHRATLMLTVEKIIREYRLDSLVWREAAE